MCDDGTDNDGDGFVDFPADPGCALPMSAIEAPQCQDGADNDGDGFIDFDGGASTNGGVPIAAADSQCVTSWKNSEAQGGRRCGLGSEFAVLLSTLLAWRRRPRTLRAS